MDSTNPRLPPPYFCPKCNKRCKKIIEIYDKPLRETRKWNGDLYELIASTMPNTEVKTICAVCETEVVEAK